MARKALTIAGDAPCALAALLAVWCTFAVVYVALATRHRPRHRAAHRPTGRAVQTAITVKELQQRLEREAAGRPRRVGVQPRERREAITWVEWKGGGDE